MARPLAAHLPPSCAPWAEASIGGFPGFCVAKIIALQLMHEFEILNK
jgi:hypothetical protein